MNPLKQYLKEKKESATAFAKRAGVSQPTIWRIINGEAAQIKSKTALLISKATGGKVKIFELLYPDQVKKKKVA